MRCLQAVWLKHAGKPDAIADDMAAGPLFKVQRKEPRPDVFAPGASAGSHFSNMQPCCSQAAWLEHAGVHDASAADTAASLAALHECFAGFQRELRAAGWDPARVVLRSGVPRLSLG